MTVKHITKVFTKAYCKDQQPNCIANWKKYISYEVNFEKVFHSFGTPLSNSMEERQWRKMIHRGTYVKHRDPRTDQQCRICKSEHETIIHIFRCRYIKPFWKQCLSFCHEALNAALPTMMEAAVIFGEWRRDTLGPMPARAFLRHAFNHLYRHICYVDLKKYKFA